MNLKPVKSHLQHALIWVLVLGGAGFLAGFIGPLVFVPEANQGPLLGIFISGPLGALLGMALYLICTALHVSDRGQSQVLGTTSALVIVVTLYFCSPEPALQGYLIDAEVQNCVPPIQKVDAAIAYWDRRIAEVTWAAPRADWQAYARQSSQQDHGAVVEMAVSRRNRIYMARKPWNKGQLSAAGWQPLSGRRSYYVPFPGACSDYPRDAKAVYFNDYDLSGLKNGPEDWPPRKLADFLDLQVLAAVPEQYRKLIGN